MGVPKLLTEKSVSNSFAAPGTIAPFHLDDRIDQFFRRAFRTRPADSFGGKQELVLLLDRLVSAVGRPRFTMLNPLSAFHLLDL